MRSTHFAFSASDNGFILIYTLIISFISRVFSAGNKLVKFRRYLLLMLVQKVSMYQIWLDRQLSKALKCVKQKVRLNVQFGVFLKNDHL